MAKKKNKKRKKSNKKSKKIIRKKRKKQLKKIKKINKRIIKLSKKTGSLCLIPGSHKFGHLIYKSSKIPAEKHKIGLVDKIIKGGEKTNYGNDLVKQLFNKKKSAERRHGSLYFGQFSCKILNVFSDSKGKTVSAIAATISGFSEMLFQNS